MVERILNSIGAGIGLFLIIIVLANPVLWILVGGFLLLKWLFLAILEFIFGQNGLLSYWGKY